MKSGAVIRCHLVCQSEDTTYWFFATFVLGSASRRNLLMTMDPIIGDEGLANAMGCATRPVKSLLWRDDQMIGIQALALCRPGAVAPASMA